MRANPGPRPALRSFDSVRLTALALMLLVLVAGGCTRWTHAAKGEREYNTDSIICQRVADDSGETEYWPRYHVYEACMAERGWSSE